MCLYRWKTFFFQWSTCVFHGILEKKVPELLLTVNCTTWERKFSYLEVFGQNKKSVVAHGDRLQWWQMEGMRGNWNRTQARWEQSFFLCLCVSEGQDEGCQWKTAAKAHKRLHSIILSQKENKTKQNKKSLDTIVCAEGSRESILLKHRINVIPIDESAATLCNWLQLSPWLCEMR